MYENVCAIVHAHLFEFGRTDEYDRIMFAASRPRRHRTTGTLDYSLAVDDASPAAVDDVSTQELDSGLSERAVQEEIRARRWNHVPLGVPASTTFSPLTLLTALLFAPLT
jgi:hypothetical protein